MRYYVDIPPEIADKVNEQVRIGKYRSPQDFFIVSIQNQLYHESQDAGTVMQEVAGPDLTSAATQSVAMASITSDLHLLFDRPEPTTIKTVRVSNLPRLGYLWGQYNRFLPVKVATRIATNLINRGSTDHVSLTELYETCARIGRDLGKDIEKKDHQFKRKRGTILSAGFPIGRDRNKSTLRFSTQFIGYLTKDKVEGAAPNLKFLELEKDDKNSTMAFVTDFGVRFASLTNPVVDRKDYSIALSDEEVTFLLDHIRSEVPREAKLIQLVLASIKEGVATPERLNEKVSEFAPHWNKSEASTMRSGVVSRICELGLLEREKDGVKVTYKLTNLGEEYLKTLASMGA